MAACFRAVQLYAGPTTVVVSNADGSKSPAVALVPDPAVTDLTACAYVVDTGGSNAWRELGNMSIDNAQVIGASVGFVWAVAWTFKAIAKYLNSNESSHHE